jgi:hypothetical protein
MVLSLMGHQNLSDEIILAERGEFYAYTAEFTPDRPVFVLMKCKANKNRPVEQLPVLGSEANVLFQFDGFNQARACSVETAKLQGLIDPRVNWQSWVETHLGLPNISTREFERICSQKDVDRLVTTCMEVCSKEEKFLDLAEGSIVAVATSDGKYGLFLLEEISSESILIAAGHVRL